MKNGFFDEILAWLEWGSKVLTLIIAAIRDFPPIPTVKKQENKPTVAK